METIDDVKALSVFLEELYSGRGSHCVCITQKQGTMYMVFLHGAFPPPVEARATTTLYGGGNQGGSKLIRKERIKSLTSSLVLCWSRAKSCLKRWSHDRIVGGMLLKCLLFLSFQMLQAA